MALPPSTLIATRHSPLEVFVVLQEINYLKWQTIQLAIQCTVDTINYLK